MLGYPSVLAWWNEETDCSIQEIIRAINGTFQTRVPRLSIDDTNVRKEGNIYLKKYKKN
jgi:hypothetical protein